MSELECNCAQRGLDDLTYEELVDQKPEMAIESVEVEAAKN